jgi:hypothetical protein
VLGSGAYAMATMASLWPCSVRGVLDDAAARRRVTIGAAGVEADQRPVNRETPSAHGVIVVCRRNIFPRLTVCIGPMKEV